MWASSFTLEQVSELEHDCRKFGGAEGKPLKRNSERLCRSADCCVLQLVHSIAFRDSLMPSNTTKRLK